MQTVLETGKITRVNLLHLRENLEHHSFRATSGVSTYVANFKIGVYYMKMQRMHVFVLH